MSRLAVDVAVKRRTRRGETFGLDAAFESDGGISVVYGPSGSGKSTLLLAVLGGLARVRGRVSLGDLTLLDSERGIDLPVRRRRVGLVFQEVPLFPHLDALHNVAFGVPGSARLDKARSLLERVGAAELARRSPRELSGGQAQRVSLARALGSEPRALLLDEPFSALDPPSRESLGQLLAELQRSSGIPFVHVTHDLGEALRIGTHLVLLDTGRVVQSGRPAEVIARPSSIAAARAVGTDNLFSGIVRGHQPQRGCSEVDIDGTRILTTLLDLPAGSPVTLGVRAEDILLSLRPIHETSARNVLRGEVREISDGGPAVELRVTTPASFRVIVTPASVRELDLKPAREVYLLIKAAAFHPLT
jgi:molybdate transport system ATP-binding protein